MYSHGVVCESVGLCGVVFGGGIGLLVWFEATIVTEETFPLGCQLQEDLAEIACGVSHGIPQGLR